MKAIVVTDQAAGTAGMKLVERPEPQAARLATLSGASYGDVVVEVHASGFTGNELEWPSTWIDRLGRDRTPSIPGHEVAGVVTSLSYGATGLSVGQRVFGLTDWTRDGTLAEYVVVEARNLAPLPADVAFTVGASVAMTGLTAWQGLFDHGRLQAGQSVLVHGAAGIRVPVSDLFGIEGGKLLERAALSPAARARVDSLLRLIDAFDGEIGAAAKATAARLADHPGYTAVQTLPGVVAAARELIECVYYALRDGTCRRALTPAAA